MRYTHSIQVRNLNLSVLSRRTKRDTEYSTAWSWHKVGCLCNAYAAFTYQCLQGNRQSTTYSIIVRILCPTKPTIHINSPPPKVPNQSGTGSAPITQSCLTIKIFYLSQQLESLSAFLDQRDPGRRQRVCGTFQLVYFYRPHFRQVRE